MGAKVEAEGYKPGHYAVGDLNANANGWRSPYEEEKTSNEQLCNGFMTTDSDYDKEMFKRTIMAHEAVFRQQVYELHRVYRLQRDLMKPYQNKEMQACPRLEGSSQRDSPSQIPLHGAKMIANAAVNNEKGHPLKFLREGSVQSSPNGFPSSDAALHTKQGMFDLEVRADNYFEDDNTSDNKPIDFLGVSSDTKHQSDSGVTLAGAEVSGRLGHNSSTSVLPTTGNLGGHHVADLNEPILGTILGRINGSVSGGPLYSLENSWQQSVWRSSITNNSLNKEYTNDKRTNEGTSSNFFDTSSRIKQEEKPFIDKGKHASNGNFVVAPRYSDTDARATFNVADGRYANINQFMYQSPNSSTGWFSRSPLEASALNILSSHDHLHRSSLNTLVAPIPSPHIGHPSVASRVGSCIVDPRSYINNADAQSFPSFNGSSTVNSYTCLRAVNQSIGPFSCNLKRIDKSDGRYSGALPDSLSASRPRREVAISSDLKQNNRLMFEHPARHCHEDNGFANGKGRNNFNLNEALSDGQEDVPVEKDGVCVGSLQHIEGEGSVSGISWLSKKASVGDSTGLEEPSKVFEHSYGTAMEMKINKDISGAALAVGNLPDSASTSVGCGAKKDKTQESAACLPPSCQKLVPRDGQADEGVITNKSGTAILNLFDLNDDAPNEDNSESSIVSHECHATSLQNSHAKRRFVIDLEVPACDDAAATAAAEDILALSMDVLTTDAPENMLQWFAELAISSNVQGCIDNSNDDDLEPFESLTLKLEETKTVVEFCSRPLAPAVTTDEHAVSPVSLLTKPKRGQQRKRRQKRDFQKDILPSISSLCRPEIIEDIQLLEGLVQTTGGSWESSFTRRRRSRGKKPKRKQADVVEEEVEVEVEISPPEQPADDAGLEAEDRGMIGWGRTTRRCRRPRCPSGITVSAAS